MKLRLRSLESKATHRIQLPNPCNLHQLKHALIPIIPPSIDSTNLFFSLNKIHALSGSDSDSLQSLGITSGDLIYYSTNPLAFSSQNPNPQNPNLAPALTNPYPQIQVSADTQMPESYNLGVTIAGSDQNGNLVGAHEEGSSKSCNPNEETAQSCGKAEGNPNEETAQSNGKIEGNPNEETAQSSGKSEGIEDMEVDDEECLVEESSKFSVPSFLKKVFVKEVGDVANGGDHKLLVIGVHAVLLESGFVGYDPVSRMRVDGFHLHDEWPKSAFGLSLSYTLPEFDESCEVVETVVLKFQNMGKFVNIYGSVGGKGFGVRRVCLDGSRFVPALSYILKNRDCHESGKLYPNREVFEFWKIVKDGLSYPLLIDLCEKAGLVPPPCFTLLPTELKLKILEGLPAIDLARVSCVSSELNFVASHNELWKLKYEEVFGIAVVPQGECQWKAKFTSAWEMRKRRKRICMPYPWREPPHFRPLFPGRRTPSLPGTPFIIGGDYDRLPSFGIPTNHGPRIFRWNCDLGGFGP